MGVAWGWRVGRGDVSRATPKVACRLWTRGRRGGRMRPMTFRRSREPSEQSDRLVESARRRRAKDVAAHLAGGDAVRVAPEAEPRLFEVPHELALLLTLADEGDPVAVKAVEAMTKSSMRKNGIPYNLSPLGQLAIAASNASRRGKKTKRHRGHADILALLGADGPIPRR